MTTLADAGPLVALIDRGQREIHEACIAALKSLSAPLLTTWPCFTEAMYLLGCLKGWAGQEAVWRFMERGTLRIHSPVESEIRRMKALMEMYLDTPMDLADACRSAATGSDCDVCDSSIMRRSSALICV